MSKLQRERERDSEREREREEKKQDLSPCPDLYCKENIQRSNKNMYFCYKISFLPISKYCDRKATLILSRRQQLTLVRNGGS